MPVIETLASSEQLQKKKSLELAWDPLTGESLLDQVLVVLLVSVLVLVLSCCMYCNTNIGIRISVGSGKSLILSS